MPQQPAEAPRIVAVAVTFNRRDLVTRLVGTLDRIEPRPDAVVVVDNASTDGTAEAVAGLGSELPLHLVELEQNTGGAGGFHAGLAAALAQGADVLWLMDDDGVPDPDCLGRLLPQLASHDFVGPVVVDEQRSDRLVFPIRAPGTSTALHQVTDVEQAATDGVLEGVVIPFNGVLLTRALVERIGLPREEFFIWGDDVEYLWRARRAGARTATVAAARFRHPSIGDLGTRMMFGLTTYNHSPSELKHYCMCRNNVANLREYHSLLGVLAFVVKTCWFYLLTRPDPGRLRLSLGAMRAGWRGDFTGHRRFLTAVEEPAP